MEAIALGICLFLAISTLAQEYEVACTIDSRSIADTYVDQADPYKNYGDSWFLYLKGGNGIRRIYANFSLPQIPQESSIHDARLRLYFVGVGPINGIEVFEVTSDWDELALTWENQPTIGMEVCEFFGAYRWTGCDVKDLLAKWLAKAPVQGISLRLRDETASTYMHLRSREYEGYEPHLRIRYTPPAGKKPIARLSVNTTQARVGDFLRVSVEVEDDFAVTEIWLMYKIHRTGAIKRLKHECPIHPCDVKCSKNWTIELDVEGEWTFWGIGYDGTQWGEWGHAKVMVAPRVEFQLQLYKGWNMIASPLETPITLDELEAAGCRILRYKGHKIWRWEPIEGWVHPDHIPHHGAWVYTARDCKLVLVGKRYEFISKPLHEGWNMISGEGRLMDVLGTCEGYVVKYKGYELYRWNPLRRDWERYTLEEALLEPGKAYYLKVQRDCELVFKIEEIPEP